MPFYNSYGIALANTFASLYGEPLSSRQQADGYSVESFINMAHL
jgi:hypothetical protein